MKPLIVKPRRHALAIAGLTLATALALASGFAAAPWAAGATAATPGAHLAAASRNVANVPALRSGTGHAVARTVNLRAAAAGRHIKAHGRPMAALGRDGKTAGADLPTRVKKEHKRLPAAAPRLPGGPNSGRTLVAPSRRPQAIWRTPPTTINSSFDGVNQGNSNCNCQPPDVNAAVGPSEIAQTVNLRLQVFDKAGNTLCGIDLNTFLGTTARLSDPRVQYDNVYDRFSMVLIPVPNSGDTPSMFLAVSQSGDACGSWFVYTVTFGGSMFPPGTLLDYPYLGQDNQPGVAGSTFNGAILSSTNNFCCAPSFGSYIGSSSFAIPKDAAYQGLPFSFPAFSVAMSTAPSTTAGIPMFSNSTTYFLAAVPGTGYDLYAMTNSPDPNNVSMTLQAVVSAPFNAPSRRVQQPGTSQTLDPLDGRIDWAPVQDGQFVWFAHGIDNGGFPSVRYGAIDVVNNIAFTASAFHSATSDDFNPSIGVTDAGNNTNYIWVNWAWTDTPNGLPTTDTVDGVLPGAGVPDLIGTDLPLITGFSTSSNFRFGDFSSVSADPVAASPTCPAGLTAVTAQEYFTSNGNWATRIASSSFC